MNRIKKGDRVMVVSGEFRGSEGVVLRVMPKALTAIVENIKKVKRAEKPSEKNRSGGHVEKEAPIALSKLALIDPKAKRPAKIKYGVDKENHKIRIAKKSGHEFLGGGKK